METHRRRIMRICVLAYAHPFGEGKYYGAERMIYYLICELKKMGHECVVFSVDGCNLPGFEYHKMDRFWEDDRDIYAEAVKKHGPFDFVQSYMASGRIDMKFWKTQNYCLEPFMIFTAFKTNLVWYSKLLQKICGGGGKVVYFGLPEEPYKVIEKDPDDYLVWIGRMDMGKAPDIAIDVAKRSGHKLILMGPAYHYPYFVDKIWPQIDGKQIIWLRAVDDEIKRRVFRKAKAFLSTNWEQYSEMFGIVNLEALAAGVPVIGWGNKGSPSAINFNGGEIIKHGVHGFINEYSGYSDAEREKSITAAVDYLKQIDGIDRKECHQLFLDRFTARTMAEDHLKYYRTIRGE